MRKFSWGIAILILWGIILSFGVFFYLKFLQPSRLGETVISFFEERFEVTPKISFIKLEFTPHPSIIIKHAELNYPQKNMNVSFAEAHASISWKTILAGRPVIGAVEIFQPKFELVRQKPFIKDKIEETAQVSLSQGATVLPDSDTSKEIFAEKQKILEENIQKVLQKLVQFEIPYFFQDGSMVIRDGSVSISYPAQSEVLSLDGIDLDLRIPGTFDGHLDLRVENGHFVAKRSPQLDFTKSHFALKGWRLDTDNITADLHIQSLFQMGSLQKLRVKPIKEAYRYFPMPEPLKFSLRTHLNYDKHLKTFESDGLLQTHVVFPMNGHNTPLEVNIPFDFHGNTINDEKNMLKLPEETKENAPYRQAFLKDNDKLPQKAFVLAPFYVNAININGAYLKIGDDSILASGELLGLFPLSPLFQGEAKVYNFSLPRWIGASRKMSGGLHNALDQIKGDIQFIVNKRGVFAPYLKGNVRGIQAEGIGSCGNFRKPDVAIRITPLSSTRLDLNPLFPEVNGKKEEKVSLPPPAVPLNPNKDKDSMFVDYHIDILTPDAKIWKVNLQKARTLISPTKDETPTLDITIDHMYEGKAEAFVTLDDGNNTIETQVKGVNLENFIYDIAEFKALYGVLDADATINLGGQNIDQILSSLKVKAEGNLSNGSFFSKTGLIEKYDNGYFSIDAKAIPFYKQNTPLPPYFQMKGDYNLFLERKYLQAKIVSNAILEVSTKNGLPLIMKPQQADILYLRDGESRFEKAHVKGDGLLGYNIPEDEFVNLHNFMGTFNDDSVQGDFFLHRKEQLDWSGNLTFDHISLDSYIFGDEEPISSKEKNSPTERPSAFPIDDLLEHSINMQVNAKKATLLNVLIHDFTSLLRLNKGAMTLEKTGANIKEGGTLQAFLEAKLFAKSPTQDGYIQTKFKFQLKDANMLAISIMRGHEILLAGNGLIQLFGNGVYRDTSEILKKLNGTFKVDIKDGYIESPKALEANKGTDLDSHKAPNRIKQNRSAKTYDKTLFSSITASGDIKDGVLHTPNFTLTGDGLSMKGVAYINLPTEEIKANATALVLGIPEIPIEIRGTIKEPVTNVKMLNAVTGTLGNITSGFFQTLGGILSSPIHILAPERTIVLD